ncbi:MAG: ribosome recycling factor [Ignavibacteriales bacterium]|nr:ribosome recycling factor [Ignavibacteriales bacterium]HOJ18312.1 ribosome recycling factor [Ignavibacteriaceae bacterium]HPO55559.1 ribosome recycling factor [Ignavibacteriaceae bacterium]
MDTIIKDAKTRMEKSIDNLRGELSKVRTGKATTAILDGIKVDYYGTSTPLKQLGNVTVLDVHTLAITPWDKTVISSVEKAIMVADLGLNPISDGTNIKVPIPPLTEERRKDFVKLTRKFGEDTKVAIRNIRRDANEHLKKAEKDKKMTEDELKKAEDIIQKATNEHIGIVDDILKHKEKEIMEV